MGLTVLLKLTLKLIYINQFHVCFHKIVLKQNREQIPLRLQRGLFSCFILNLIPYFKGVLQGLILDSPLASYRQHKRTGFYEN
jgi:hypothetical protein